MKRILSFLLIVLLVTGLAVPSFAATSTKPTAEVRGMWVPFCDFEALGLKDKTEAQFRTNFRAFLKKAKAQGVNRIYFHVRAFDDASWKSKTFKASEYLTSKASGKKTAAKTYTYDPLKVVIQECRKKDMAIEAWMNPYRITHERYLNPKSGYSTKRIRKAVKELAKYDLDGIHFDDYFYHSRSKYRTPTWRTALAVTVKGKDTKALPSNYYKKKYVNKMVKTIYKEVHKKKGRTFGISPQGNYDNCMASGADVDTWLAKKGYVDYLMPQIYWTDKWGRKGDFAMFSGRLLLWTGLKRRKGVRLYVGLALYRTGESYKDDPGWKKSNTNLKRQVVKLRKAGCSGFSLYTAKDLYRDGAAKELKYLKKVLK